MILCVDCGNTRLKWGLREAGAWVATGAVPLAGGDLPDLRARRVVACNVAGEAGRRAVEALAAPIGPVHWVRSVAAQGGVTNGYEQPEQLGADRWAALIGARGLHPGSCLVVMSGTATTVDLLRADGRFAGGLILPGLGLMRSALAANTADLPTARGRYAEEPRNTFDAIASGCIQATVGAVEHLFRRIAAEPGALCLLSGGAVPDFAAQLAVPHRLVDNLVLEGLARIATAPGAAQAASQ